MSLRKFQAALRDLYLKDSFRRKFFSYPTGSARGYGLTPKETSALTRLDPGQLGHFCAGLEVKNSKRFQKSFRNTSRLFGMRFTALCREYADRHADLRDWPEKLEAFAQLLFHTIRNQNRLAPYALELARFEYAKAMLGYGLDHHSEVSLAKRLGLVRRSRRWLDLNGKSARFRIGFVGRYSYDVLKLAGTHPFPKRAVGKKPTQVLFFQVSGLQHMQTAVLNAQGFFRS